MIDSKLDGSGKRLIDIRKALDKTQIEFAEMIKTTNGHISDMEKERKNISERTIKILCLEFNVNEHWLRTGNGNMFNETLTDVVDQLAAKYDLSELEKTLIMEYGKLKKEQKEAFRQYFSTVIGKLGETAATAEPEIKPVAMGKEENKEVRPKKYIPVSTDAEIEAELADYRKELEAEKKGQSACVDIKETKVAKTK